MSKIKLTEILLDRRGAPIVNAGADNAPATMLDALYQTIDTLAPGESLPANDKLRLAKIGIKLAAAGGEIEFSAAETTLILDRSGVINSVQVHGLLVQALDPAQLTET